VTSILLLYFAFAFVDIERHLFQSCAISISTCGSTSYLANVDFNHVVLGRPLLGVPSTLPCSASVLGRPLLGVPSTLPCSASVLGRPLLGVPSTQPCSASVFGRPLLGVPSTQPCSASVFAIRFSSIRTICSSHLRCLPSTFSTIVSVRLGVILMCSFLIMSIMWMPIIFLTSAISNISSFFSSASSRVPTSKLYNAMGTMSELNNLIFLAYTLVFQTLSMSLITFKAVAVLTLMSTEQLPLVVMVKLRYLELFHSLFPLSVSPSSILFLTICSGFVLNTIHSLLV